MIEGNNSLSSRNIFFFRYQKSVRGLATTSARASQLCVAWHQLLASDHVAHSKVPRRLADWRIYCSGTSR